MFVNGEAAALLFLPSLVALALAVLLRSWLLLVATPASEADSRGSDSRFHRIDSVFTDPV
jgi:hypothetical protein